MRCVWGKFAVRALGKAQAERAIEGEVKVIADAGDDAILGVHIIGAHAADIVHEAAVAMQAQRHSLGLGADHARPPHALGSRDGSGIRRPRRGDPRPSEENVGVFAFKRSGG